MGRKRIELTDEVESLVDKYMTMNGDKMDLNELTNKALKYYVINHLSPNEIKEAIKQKDIKRSKYVDDILSSSYRDFGGY
ncbi:hypothetical protein [Lactobacillus sp. PSON]|uniref:hypothetical protein n=1 Tax=Lactobacillus sp. PSON TaxID=3455454 RepID=UPI00404161CC